MTQLTGEDAERLLDTVVEQGRRIKRLEAQRDQLAGVVRALLGDKDVRSTMLAGQLVAAQTALRALEEHP